MEEKDELKKAMERKFSGHPEVLNKLDEFLSEVPDKEFIGNDVMCSFRMFQEWNSMEVKDD